MAIENIEDYKKIGPSITRPMISRIVDNMNEFRNLLNQNKIQELNRVMAETNKIWRDNPELQKMVEYARLYEDFLVRMGNIRDVAEDIPGLKPIIQPEDIQRTISPLTIPRKFAKTITEKGKKKKVVPPIVPEFKISKSEAERRAGLIFETPEEKKKRRAIFVLPIPGKKEKE